MTSKGKRELVYEGYTLPKLTIKELLARNARKDCELKFLQKQLNKAKEDLESDFSRTRSNLLSRVHSLLLEGQTYDLGDDRSSSDEEQMSTMESSSANDSSITDLTSSWETSLKNLSSSQIGEDANMTGLHRNLQHNQPWAEKVEHFQHSLVAKAEPVSSKPSLQRRKISWGGRANVMPENWDARSVLSKSSSEGNLPSKATCSSGDDTQPRVRRHTVVGRSRSFNPKSSGLTKEAIQNQKSSSTKRQGRLRRHTVCARDLESRLTPTEEEKCPVKKPLSELLPPIKLPPIYLQESKGKELGKKSDKSSVNNTHVQTDVRKPVDTKRLTEDLHYCRYLRVHRKDNTDYS